MTRLSVAMIARDEARHIGAAIESVAGLADEIVVLLDERTRDATETICRERGARVSVEPWRGFPAQRNHALDLCRGDWVLFLDGDERVTPELCAEIRATTNVTGLTTGGYWIPRRNIFFGRALRGGGWYPDYQLRLLRRGRVHYDEDRLVHELAVVDGDTAYLSGHLLHLNIERMSELWRKQHSYAIQEAQTLFRAGRRARWRNLIGAPVREFVRRYVRLGGWRDGALGLFLCAALGFFEGVKYYHLIRMGRA